jgi:hypothetical protein
VSSAKSNGNKQPKGQHILPQRYQAGFADADGCVWHLDRRCGMIASTHPKRVAVENHFYTYEPRTNPDATAIEGFSQTITKSLFGQSSTE